MPIDGIIIFGGTLLLGVAGLVLHWWLGVQLRRDAEREGTGNVKRHAR